MAESDMVKVMRQMLPPTGVRQVRNFIGMCSYYRRFIPNFSDIAKPLIRLTKKSAKFEWTKECQTAFDLLKESLTTVPVLATQILASHTFSIQILVMIQEQDTQGEMKSNEPNEEPLHSLSHKLTTSQTNWHTIDKVDFLILYALQKLDQYLHDSEFVIRRDEKPLKSVMNSPVKNKKIQHLTTNICGYNCKIEYVEGRRKVCADMLSQ